MIIKELFNLLSATLFMLILNLYWSVIISLLSPFKFSSTRFTVLIIDNKRCFGREFMIVFPGLCPTCPFGTRTRKRFSTRSFFTSITIVLCVLHVFVFAATTFTCCLKRFSTLFFYCWWFEESQLSVRFVMKSSRVGSFWIDLTNLFIHSMNRLQMSAILVYDGVSWLFHDSSRCWFKFSTSDWTNFETTSRKTDESSAWKTRYFLLLIDKKYDLRDESISDKWRATYHQVDSLTEL